ncbi:MAG: heme-binding protein [Alphaproteobacteria bacterium]|nr:heme-binding protein [Alphaproteobacteria bacterium]
MTALTLDQASIIVDKALEKGREQNFAPLTVAVLDAGGQLKALKREDGCSLLRPEIAAGKAWGVLGMGFGGRELARRAQRAPGFMQALTVASGGRMVPVPGGVLIRDANGQILGAVGISGDTSENDEICAVHGIACAGLAADTGDAG